MCASSEHGYDRYVRPCNVNAAKGEITRHEIMFICVTTLLSVTESSK